MLQVWVDATVQTAGGGVRERMSSIHYLRLSSASRINISETFRQPSEGSALGLRGGIYPKEGSIPNGALVSKSFVVCFCVLADLDGLREGMNSRRSARDQPAGSSNSFSKCSSLG